MDFDPTQIPMLHENPMYHMEQNQRFQHICDIAVQASNIEKLISSYILTGDHLCTLLKDILGASTEMEFVCTNQNYGEILQSLDEFQESFKNHFRDVQGFCLIELRNLIKKDFPELVESKKIYTKNLEKYYQVQDHYLSLPKKTKTKVNKERQNEFRKAFTESASSFLEYVIRLDTLEAKISNLFGTFILRYPKSFLNATQPPLEKEIKLTEKIDSICPDYKSIEKRLQVCKQDFLSSIPQYFQKINSHFTPTNDTTNVKNSNSQNINQVLNSSENQSTTSSFLGDSKSSSSQVLVEEQNINKNNSSNQIFTMSGVGNNNDFNSEILEKQGYMWKRCGKVTKTWERKYFVCNQGVLSYSLSVENATNPSNTIQLIFSSVQPNETEDRPFVFNLVTQSKIYVFQAPSQLDFDEWVAAIQNGIAVGLSNLDNESNAAPTNNMNNMNINNENNINNINNNDTSGIDLNNNNSSYIDDNGIAGTGNDNTVNTINGDIINNNVLNPNSHEMSEIKTSPCNVTIDSSPSRFPYMRKNSFPTDDSTSPNQNMNRPSDFNFLAFSNVRRGSTINKKTVTNINLSSVSDSIPKIPNPSTPPSSPNFSFTLCTCADCGASRANWCIINRGLVVCDNCSGIHRSIPKISTVRSLKLDKIDKYNMKILSLLSNNILNTFIEAKLLQSESMDNKDEVKRINNSSSPEERTEFIKKKYIEKAFVDPSFILKTNKERQKEKEHSKHREKEEKKHKEIKDDNSNEAAKEKDKSEKSKPKEIKDDKSSNETTKEKVKSDKTKTKSKDKNKTKDDDKIIDSNQISEKKEKTKETKDKKSKNKTDVDNKLSEVPFIRSIGSDTNFSTLKVNDDLHADDDDVESLEVRKHQGKKHHGTRRRSLTTAQNQRSGPTSSSSTTKTDQATHHRHVSDCNIEQQSVALKEAKNIVMSNNANINIIYHDVFEAIQTQDLFELMKIAFIGGLQEASLKGGFRPIHAASCIGNPIIIVAIIENDPSSINQADDKNWTPLSYASYHNNEKAIDALIAYGANVIVDSENGIDYKAHPFIIAKELHHDNILRKLQHFSLDLPPDYKIDRIVPLNVDFVPQEINQSMVINEDQSSGNQQSIVPMTDKDMSQIQQALKNMSKRPRMRRKSVTDAHKNINNPDEY